jgi:hypothetical protein
MRLINTVSDTRKTRTKLCANRTGYGLWHTARCRRVVLSNNFSSLEPNSSSRFDTPTTPHKDEEGVINRATIHHLQTRWQAVKSSSWCTSKYEYIYLACIIGCCDRTDILAYRPVFTKHKTKLTSDVVNGSVLRYVILRHYSYHWHWQSGWLAGRPLK